MPEPKLQSDSLQLQDRDLALLCGLFESRVMTAAHIAVLYFESKREYTKKRLQKIKAAGFIAERKRRMNEPSIHFLTRKAFAHLNSQGMLSQYPPLGMNSFAARANVSELTLRHELEIMDVKAAFHKALAKSERFSISEFSTWPLLHQFETPRQGYGADILVKPDGFISIHEKEVGSSGFAHDCFLEVDRSSEKLDVLINRAGCYLDYYKSGGFAVRNGATRDKFEDFPFRVLMVFKSAERRNNTAERLLQNNPPILSQAWLATLADATAAPLGAIWIQPRDYRDVTRNTPFDAGSQSKSFVYRRNLEREVFIEMKIKKLRLLET